jgi:hypothetical protein
VDGRACRDVASPARFGFVVLTSIGFSMLEACDHERADSG